MNSYPYLKHKSDAHEDGWLRKMVKEEGHVAGWVWWCLLEMVHKHGQGDFLERDINDVARACLTSPGVVRRVLTAMATVSGTLSRTATKVRWDCVGTVLHLEIKNFREFQKKFGSKGSQSVPDGSPQKSSNVKVELIQVEAKASMASAAPKTKQDTVLQILVNRYKQARQITGKINWGRNTIAAKKLLAALDGSTNKALNYISERGAYLTQQNLDWTLETIAKHASENLNGHTKQKSTTNSVCEKCGVVFWQHIGGLKGKCPL